jgi:hypothetical protein
VDPFRRLTCNRLSTTPLRSSFPPIDRRNWPRDLNSHCRAAKEVSSTHSKLCSFWCRARRHLSVVFRTVREKG